MLNDADLSDEMKAKIMEKMSGKSRRMRNYWMSCLMNED